jgi:GNAT superfamily N-acetyltransferase
MSTDLHRIQSYLRVAAPRGRDHTKIGPFLATFSRDSDNPYLNYAIPDADATPSRSHVDSLVDAYLRRERRPRLEYIPSLAPAVEAALLASGFEPEQRTPLMVRDPSRRPTFDAPEGIELLVPRTDEELRGAAAVQWEAYAEPGPVPARVAGSLRATLASGGIVVLARDAATGEPVGAGLCTAPHAATTELAAIGVLPRFRRRGIAAAMTRFLSRRAVTAGLNNVFLMAAGAAEERIYARAGFSTVSEVLHISFTSA